MKNQCKSWQTFTKRLVAASLALCIILLPTVTLAQDVCQRTSDSVVECDGDEYVILSREEMLDAIEAEQELRRLKDEKQLLNTKAELLGQQLSIKDEMLQLQSEDIKYKDEYILKLQELDEPDPWYMSPTLHIAIGVVTAGLLFFSWEYARRP